MTRNILIITVIALLAACAAAPPVSQGPQPPVAQRIEHAETIHGVTLEDPYHWLKDKSRSDQAVLDYVEAENDYADAWMQPLQPLVDTLYAEILARIDETDLSVPHKIDDWYYYERREEGLQYPILCRRHEDMGAPERVLLDQNELAEGHEYFALGATLPSPDHKLLAYSYDTTADEVYTLVVKDLETGELLPDVIEGASDVTWAAPRTLFYTTDDISGRSAKLWRHDLGSEEEDQLVYHEEDGRFYLYSYRSESDKFIVVAVSSKTTTEMRILPADNPDAPLQLVAPREQGVEYYLDHRENGFYILTNADGASSYKIAWTHEDSLARENWRDFIPWRDSVTVGCAISRDWMAVTERYGGLKHLRVINLNTSEEHEVAMPEGVYSLRGVYFTDYDDPTLRFTYTSMVTPWTVYEYNCEARGLITLKEQNVIGYDRSKYKTERIWATAPDGVKVPITLLYRPDMMRMRGNPCFLEGYGAYGDANDPLFFNAMFSLVDRGFIYALAHVRGGGEMGRQWYEDGKMLNKPNTFSDYIACAERLRGGWASADGMVGYGGSAGGMLIGAAANMRPDLFRVVIADVPFVDVVNTMLDPTLTATVSEYEEWGNPADKEYFECMLSYDPYQNVTAQDYPSMFIAAGFYDPRVNYWEPAKYTAKLRYLKTDDNPLLFRTDMSGGHAGASGRYDFIRELAIQYAFVLHEVK